MSLDDISMITLSKDDSIHHDLIDGKENAKMTVVRMKMSMLKLRLPFMVRDLIAPEVLQYIEVCTVLTLICTVIY
jgi:hypothetical protein